jgi:hypothetical protein
MTEYALIASLLTSVTCALVPEATAVASRVIVVLRRLPKPACTPPG